MLAKFIFPPYYQKYIYIHQSDWYYGTITNSLTLK